MNVSTLVWTLTLVGLSTMLLLDMFVIGRRPHTPSMRESALWVSLYVGLALLFGLVVWAAYGARYAGEFYAGWLTEYSLSVDNLFVFVIIMTRFAVPREFQQRVLFTGIVLALILRGGFIAAGTALIHRFVWIFYIFGAFLLVTAFRLMLHGEDDPGDFRENFLVRASRKVLPISDHYHGAQLVTLEKGKRRHLTPLFLVMVAIGTTDVVFALDSIPAIFGLTKVSYLVFTANVFALMGLRQLYFLLGGLLDRLTYLSLGLSAVLGFIGAKLILEALRDNNLPFLNGGQPIAWAPEIPIWVSLSIIGAILALTAGYSIYRSRRQPQTTAAGRAQPRLAPDSSDRNS